MQCPTQVPLNGCSFSGKVGRPGQPITLALDITGPKATLPVPCTCSGALLNLRRIQTRETRYFPGLQSTQEYLDAQPFPIFHPKIIKIYAMLWPNEIVLISKSPFTLFQDDGEGPPSLTPGSPSHLIAVKRERGGAAATARCPLQE